LLVLVFDIGTRHTSSSHFGVLRKVEYLVGLQISWTRTSSALLTQVVSSVAIAIAVYECIKSIYTITTTP